MSKRFAIIGNSGSGKSTLAAQLTAKYQIDSLDLDTIYWEPNQIAVAREPSLVLDDLHRFCLSNEQWVIEGCYGDLVQASLVYEPDLLFLNPGEEQCIANCRSRPFEPHKYSSKQEQDAKLGYLLDWVRDYYFREGDMSLAGHQALFDRYDGPKREVVSMEMSGSDNDA